MKSETRKNNNLIITTIKGVIPSIILTLILILVFALLIRFFNIPDTWIFPVNQAIKFISLFVGIILALKSIKEKGFMVGTLIGIFYSISSFLLFSILRGNFTFSLSNVYDILLTMLAGGLIGIISVNIIK